VIVYVESNFVLELALGQEQAADAELILAAAERGSIELAIPDVSFGEPFSTVLVRSRTRERVVTQLNQQIQDLTRSPRTMAHMAALQPIPALLQQLDAAENLAVFSVAERLLHAGRTLRLSADSLTKARAFQAQFGLQPFDAIIIGAVVSDLAQQPQGSDRWFVSRNWRDFDDPGIRADLAQFGCAYAESFGLVAAHLPVQDPGQ
jgi:predicted nucleic acid-binding protein